MVGTYIGAQVARKSDVEKAREAARAPEWDSFTSRIMARLDKQSEEIAALKAEVGALEKRFDEMQQLYWKAVMALRRVFARDEGLVDVAAMPEELADDVLGR